VLGGGSLMKKSIIASLLLFAVTALTIPASTNQEYVFGNPKQLATQIGDQYASMFRGMDADNPVVANTIRTYAVTFGFKTASEIKEFVYIAQEEFRKESAVLDESEKP
jgi:hypothetical protein